MAAVLRAAARVTTDPAGVSTPAVIGRLVVPATRSTDRDLSGPRQPVHPVDDAAVAAERGGTPVSRADRTLSRTRVPVVVLLPALLLCGLAALVVSVSIGAVRLDLSSVWRVMASHLLGTAPVGSSVTDQIVWQLRLPRALLALVVGGGLAVAGVAIQALVRNPLADPYVLGVESGASLAAVGLIVSLGVIAAGPWLPVTAFAGALAAVVLVFSLARQRGSLSPTRLVLAGVAVSYLLSSVTSFLQFVIDPHALQSVLFWLLGSVAGATWAELGVPAAVVLASAVWLTLQGRALNALLAGEETAVALGVSVQRLRWQLLLVTSILVGAVVSVAGGVGFVGLMIPHVVRLLVGSDHRRVLPVSLVLGAVFLVWVDIAARVVAAPSELPIGIFTAAIGAPFFLWLMRSQGRRRLS